MLGSDESVTAEVLDIRPFPFRERSADPESSFLEQVSSEKSEVGSASLRRGRYVSRTSFLTPVNPTPSYQPIAVPGKQIIRTPPPGGLQRFPISVTYRARVSSASRSPASISTTPFITSLNAFNSPMPTLMLSGLLPSCTRIDACSRYAPLGSSGCRVPSAGTRSRGEGEDGVRGTRRCRCSRRIRLPWMNWWPLRRCSLV